MEMRDILYILFGYLLGSILFARLGGLIFKKTDITAESPDKNPGTMNAFTYGGFRCGVFVPQRRSARKPADALVCDGGAGFGAYSAVLRYQARRQGHRGDIRVFIGAFAALDSAVRSGRHLHFLFVRG